MAADGPRKRRLITCAAEYGRDVRSGGRCNQGPGRASVRSAALSHPSRAARRLIQGRVRTLIRVIFAIDNISLHPWYRVRPPAASLSLSGLIARKDEYGVIIPALSLSLSLACALRANPLTSFPRVERFSAREGRAEDIRWSHEESRAINNDMLTIIDYSLGAPAEIHPLTFTRQIFARYFLAQVTINSHATSSIRTWLNGASLICNNA